MCPHDPARTFPARRVLLSMTLAAFVALPALAWGPGLPGGPEGAPVPRDLQLRALKALQQRLLWKGARRHFLQAAQRAQERRATPRRGAVKPGARATRPVGEDYEAPVSAGRAPADALTAFATAAVPANVRVNDPTGDVSASSCQSEESIAFLGDDILVAWNDSQGFSTGGDVQGWGYSTDGGATFVDGGSFPHPAGYPSWKWTSDPVVTVNQKTGVFYYCGLVDPDASHNGIGVAYGHFAGSSFVWDDIVLVRSVANSTTFLDKQWIVADSASNHVYVTNTTFTSTDWIDFYRSSDGGATWTAAAQISDPGTNGYVQGSRPVVGPDGELYVTWKSIGSTDADDFRFRKSADHGASFDAEIALANYYDQFGTGSPGFNRDRGFSFPSIAVDRTTGPNRGRIHAVWSETWDILGQPFAVNPGKAEVESNNTAATATAFTAGQTLRGTVTTGSPVDYDYWKVALGAGQTLVLWADSLASRATYTMRLFAPTPDDAQRLAFAAESDSTASTPGQAYYSFTAPVAGTYYLRMAPYFSTSRLFKYRILTALGSPGADHGRDTRDVLTCWSDDGATWSAPTRVNDGGIGFDEFLPEAAVGADGCPYVTWYDYREDTYGSRCHQYASRSLDGGASWQTNVRITSAIGNFTTCSSNMAPNMGDYSSTTDDDRYVRAAWSDARGSNPDTWTAAIDTWHALRDGPPDQAVTPLDALNLAWTVDNLNPLFANDYAYELTSARGWPMPAPGTLAGVPAAGSSNLALSVTVPDTAANGPSLLTLAVRNQKGTRVLEWAVTLDVTGQTAVAPEANALALAPVRPNPASRSARVQYALPRDGRMALRIYGLRGELVRTLADGAGTAGPHGAVWDGRDENGRAVASGTYFVRLEAGGRILTERVAWMR